MTTTRINKDRCKASMPVASEQYQHVPAVRAAVRAAVGRDLRMSVQRVTKLCAIYSLVPQAKAAFYASAATPASGSPDATEPERSPALGVGSAAEGGGILINVTDAYDDERFNPACKLCPFHRPPPCAQTYCIHIADNYVFRQFFLAVAFCFGSNMLWLTHFFE